MEFEYTEFADGLKLDGETIEADRAKNINIYKSKYLGSMHTYD